MHLLRSTLGLATAVSLAVLSGCGPSYSPNTYDADAVQQANAVQRGVVIGERTVKVSANAAVGTVTGAAAGGIAGSTVGDSGTVKALSALGGSLVGGLVGSGVQHAQGDTNAVEYIVRESNNNLVSVTQRDKAPLPIGERVLVIAGRQARIVADYTVSSANPEPSKVTPGTTPRPSAAQQAGTVTAVPHGVAAPGSAPAQNPAPALGGAAAPQTLSAKPPASSSAAEAGGSNSHAAAAGGDTAASAATAAAVASVLAAPSGNPGDPAPAAAEPGKPVSAGTVALPGAAGAGAPAVAGEGTAASSAGGKANAINPP